jgi:hypothetical protein
MVKVGRNDPCPCGSGKKYKKCCLRKPALATNVSKHYFNLKGKKAEKIVHDLALKTFLTDWCYLNPKLPNGKELCDLLVVFDDVAIIWQVKDLKLDKNGRYKKAEVEKNLRQLSGAYRQLFDLKNSIELENPRRGKENFNPREIKEIYLLSALLGEGEEIFSSVEEVKGHTVHVLNKDFIEIVLNELDTISDFIDYLRKKEKFLAQDKKIIIEGGEEELLAYYLFNGRSFKRFQKANLITIQRGMWEYIQNKPEYKAKKKEDEISYVWDDIINRAHEGGSGYELVARELARPNRFQRRYLSKAYVEARIKAHEDSSNDSFRRVVPAEGVTYCFLFQNDPEPRKYRKATLGIMCFIARGKFRQNKKVLGIATEKKIRPMCSYDFCLLNIPTWTEENQAEMERIQEETGIFLNPIIKESHEDEYPRVDDTSNDKKKKK